MADAIDKRARGGTPGKKALKTCKVLVMQVAVVWLSLMNAVRADTHPDDGEFEGSQNI
jgi:hypothetical protein